MLALLPALRYKRHSCSQKSVSLHWTSAEIKGFEFGFMVMGLHLCLGFYGYEFGFRVVGI